MSRVKGQISSEKSLQALREHGLQTRTPEERRAIAMKAVEARKKNAERRKESMTLYKLGKELLNTKCAENQKKLLKQFGFKDEDCIQGATLMLALYKKGLTGDVAAISKYVEMMDKLEAAEVGKDVSGQQIVINLVQSGEVHHRTEEQEKDIWRVENGILDEEEQQEDEWDISDSDDVDWGSEVYDG